MFLTIKAKHKGFTLIEVMVALMIFATVAIVAVGGIQAIIRGKDAQITAEESLGDWQVGYAVMKRDLYQVINRPVRDEQGKLISGFIGDPAENIQPLDQGQSKRLFEFTRMGAQNPLYAAQKSTLLRVRYQLEGNELYRITWPVLDRIATTKYNKRKLFDNVKNISVVYLDAIGGANSSWIMLNLDSAVDLSEGQQMSPFFPATIRVSLTTEQHSGTWSYLLPGGRRIGLGE